MKHSKGVETNKVWKLCSVKTSSAKNEEDNVKQLSQTLTNFFEEGSWVLCEVHYWQNIILCVCVCACVCVCVWGGGSIN